MTNHHAELAEMNIASLNGNCPADTIQAVSALAQAHATLALVEEQRTANLIAFLTFRSAYGTFPANATFLDIATRLGLN